jgi:hypothetical protein
MKKDVSQFTALHLPSECADEAEQALISRPPLLPVGISFGLLMLGFGLWLAADTDLFADSRAELAWDRAIRSPIDRSSPLSSDSIEIILQRSNCFGGCPVYQLRIGADGHVDYYGRHYVCAFGEHTSRADPYAVRHLVQAMEAAEFYRLGSPVGLIPDAQVTTVSLAHEGRSNRVRFVDDEYDMLVEIADRIDGLANAAQWLPTPSTSWQPECKRRDGSIEPARFSETDP